MNNDGLNQLNDNELAAYFHRLTKFRKAFEEGLKRDKLYVKAGEDLAAIRQIFTQRFEDRGVSAINTPNGTIHTVGRTSARIVDPQVFGEFLLATRDLSYVDLKANMTTCRSYLDENGNPVPGVELTTFRQINITTPKGGS